MVHFDVGYTTLAIRARYGISTFPKDNPIDIILSTLFKLKKNEAFLSIIASVSLYKEAQNFAIAEHILSSHSTIFHVHFELLLVRIYNLFITLPHDRGRVRACWYSSTKW